MGFELPAEEREFFKNGKYAEGTVTGKDIHRFRRVSYVVRYEFTYLYPEDFEKNSGSKSFIMRDRQNVSRSLYDSLKVGDDVGVTYLEYTYLEHTPPVYIPRTRIEKKRFIGFSYIFCYIGGLMFIFGMLLFLAKIRIIFATQSSDTLS